MFAKNHSHGGSVRGMHAAETGDKKGFIDHFIQVSLSDEQEGGWNKFHKPVKKWTDFFAYSSAEIDFRNSTGNGPIDEYRVKVQAQSPLNIVMAYALNKNREKRCYEKESYLCGGDSNSDYKQYYVAEGMRGLFKDRDMLIEEYSGMVEFEEKIYGVIVRRSISNEEIYSLKKTSTMKRVRGNVIMSGYLFQEEQGRKGTDLTTITYLENIDWSGVFNGILMNSIVPSKLRMKIDDILAFVEEENSGEGMNIEGSISDFGSTEFGGDESKSGRVEMSVMGGVHTSIGLYDIFSGLRKSFGRRKDRPSAVDDGQGGLELGNIYSGGEDGSRTRVNPMSVKRPSDVPLPPIDWEGYKTKEYKHAKAYKLKQEEDMKKYNQQVAEDISREAALSKSKNPVIVPGVPVFKSVKKNGGNED